MRRWYDDACGAALALEFVGERWSLLILRELMFGPRRFGEIRAHLAGISANILTQRLESLTAAGLVTRRTLPPPASVPVYDLTDWGREIEPVFQALGRWATRSRHHDPTRPLSPASAMLSLGTMLDREKAAGEAMTIGFRLGADRFLARLAGGDLSIVRAEPDDADAVVTGSTTALVRWIYGKRTLTDMAAEGLTVAGDVAAAERFARLFALPAKIRH